MSNYRTFKNSEKFIKLETRGSHLLWGGTILALILSNSPWDIFYEKIFSYPIEIYVGPLELKTNLLFLINEVLMTFFFLVVTLEIKYELIKGALNSVRKATLPLIAALGGMIVPALIYLALNHHSHFNLRGWAIPVATDIAFALGILSLLGNRIPPSLKAFLAALAIIDDLIAIIIIAFFYTDHFLPFFLCISLICFGLLIIINFKGIHSLIPYCIIGVILWISLLFSDIHPTLSGVIVALTIPLSFKEHEKNPPLYRLTHKLHPMVALGILPLFAFANAGISLFDFPLSTLHFTIILGVLLSLFVGKQVGIFFACWLAVKLRIAQLPDKVRLIELYGVAIICGIGFTISLFIGTLAFGEINTPYLSSVKIGVLGGSLLSGITGYLLLVLTKRTHS